VRQDEPLIEFVNRKTRERFQEAILAALDEYRETRR
jgi:hypothetical protein